LRWAEPSSKESHFLCKKDYETEEEARFQQRAAGPLMNEWKIVWVVNDELIVKDREVTVAHL
jgi:hypothetical protein